ncbi:lasso peptide biosynthesis B2 protein [Phenylobacterium montanum]|uniref:Lasso peptide biosynthesis B2 protein n=1 Tax=Phenylobacterium montanum TaxID=2823693 RepID=A0A975G420_9CAUL|nr:lasso peptide biosynthesis B2 protein [Caulobacter sp. S6]QUD90132.1 lasso peptide biosynthesis B2 protein [Caulobacter sp. S6]
MPIQLSGDITFCETAGRLVFLDSARDRYFSLGGTAEHAFRQLWAGKAIDDCDAARLGRFGLLEPAETIVRPIQPPITAAPTRSALETGIYMAFRRQDLVQTARALALAEWSLRRGFGPALRRLAQRKAALPATPDAAAPSPAELALAYHRHRSALPFRKICLRDSLALLELLTRHGARADLVFGVKLDPFNAHCWVQAGEVVLSDALDVALAHQPIRVV